MANKSTTIKNATDKELDELLIRLRKEYEVQSLIGDLKRRSSTYGLVPYDRPEISTEQPIESLYHYGVLGMRWGKRRARGLEKPSLTDNQSDDHKKKVSLGKKRLSEMSNAELKEFTTRLNLEKQYKDLTKQEVSAGKKFVSDILGTAAKQTATTYVTKYMSKGVEELLKKASK